MDCVSTGSFDFNDFLGGGYEKGVVTMIVGPPGSGKTNFSVLAACSSAKDGKVVFVDTEGGFSVERVKQIVGKKYENILKNILLLSPLDFSEQEESFEKLEIYLKKDGVNMIVLDSIAMLYRLEVGIANSLKNVDRVCEVNSSVSSQFKNLVKIARKLKIPIIVTNQVWGNFLSYEDALNGVKREVNIVGGDLFKYWSKCIVELRHGRSRKAVLLKHRSISEREMRFEIRNEGVFKKKARFS